MSNRKVPNLYDPNIAKNVIIPYYKEIDMTTELLKFFSGPRNQTAKWVGNCIVVKAQYRLYVDFWEETANEIIQKYMDNYFIHFNDSHSMNKFHYYEFCLHKVE
jgi:hypothetical protein